MPDVLPVRRSGLRAVLGSAFAASLPSLARAECAAPGMTDPAQVRAGGRELLIVTHASDAYDSRLASKRGLDALLASARRRRTQTVFLAGDEPARTHFAGDREAGPWVFSEGGELRFDVDATRVLLAGGHLEICLRKTMHDVIARWAQRPARDRTLVLVADAIYANGRDIDHESPQGQAVARFLDIVAHGRPGGEYWRKLTLLELMALVRPREARLQMLIDALPHWQRTMPADWRVEMRVDDERLVLRHPRGRAAATLCFEFMESAVES